MLSRINSYNIVLVGAGGNGSLISLFLSRLLYGLPDVRAQLTIADGDIVEEKNIKRQHFAPADLGKNKAEVLATRYGGHFGLKIGYHPHYIEDDDTLIELLGRCSYTALPILVGAGDNNKLRNLMHEAFNRLHNIAYIDCGCEETAGQAVLGLKRYGREFLPPLAHFYPDVLEEDTEPAASCAEAPMQDISANIMSASAAFFFLNNIIAFKKVPTQKVTFDAHNMIMVPTYIESKGD